jgi:hypothetical protein
VEPKIDLVELYNLTMEKTLPIIEEEIDMLIKDTLFEERSQGQEITPSVMGRSH